MRLTVVGLGCGSAALMTGQAREAIADADVVFVSPAYRRLVDFHPRVVVMQDLQTGLGEIESALDSGSVAVGVSGDPGIFSFLAMLKRRFPAEDGDAFTVVPGISSLSCLFAKLGESWADAAIVSGHGRTLSKNGFLRTVTHSAKTVVFCDRTRNPSWACEVLRDYEVDFCAPGAHRFRVAVGENLSLPDERLTVGRADDLLTRQIDFSEHALIAVFNESPQVPAISRPRDGDFIRADSSDKGNAAQIPMTRQEVRSLVLDELDLQADSIVWDIGAGTGSVAVACALLCPGGEVHAVERLPEGVALIARNRKKFQAHNLAVYEGEACDLLDALPCPTHVFVGGSGGRLGEILARLPALGGGIRVCVSSVTLETAAALSAVMLDSTRYRDLSVVNVAVSRSRALGGSTLMAGQNPVALWTATTRGADEEKEKKE